MRGQHGAVRPVGQDRAQAEDEKGSEAKRHRERGRKKMRERHRAKEKHPKATQDTNPWTAKGRQLGLDTERARVLVIKQFNTDLFPRLVFHETIKKILHRSSRLRLCGDKGSPGPQESRGGDGVPGFPDVSGSQLKGMAHRRGEGSSGRLAWALKRVTGNESQVGG